MTQIREPKHGFAILPLHLLDVKVRGRYETGDEWPVAQKMKWGREERINDKRTFFGFGSFDEAAFDDAYQMTMV